MSYAFASPGALGAEAKVGVQLEAQLSTDLAKRFEQGDWSIDKQSFGSYAKSAGGIAGAAACTAAGVAIAAPICGTVAGAVAGFLTDTVWGALSDWLSDDSDEKLAEALLLQTQNALKVSVLYLQMVLAVQQAQATLTKLASDLKLTEIQWTLTSSGKAVTPAHPSGSKYTMIKLGGHLKPEDLLAQLHMDGLPTGKGAVGVPDWPSMLSSGYYAVPTIYQDAQSYLHALQKAEAKTASRLVAAATAKKAFEQKVKQKKIEKAAEEAAQEASAKAAAIGWTLAGIAGLAGLWWWTRRRRR